LSLRVVVGVVRYRLAGIAQAVAALVDLEPAQVYLLRLARITQLLLVRVAQVARLVITTAWLVIILFFQQLPPQAVEKVPVGTLHLAGREVTAVRAVAVLLLIMAAQETLQVQPLLLKAQMAGLAAPLALHSLAVAAAVRLL